MCGMVNGVVWQTENLPPGGAPRQSAPVSIAVGNTAFEALTALIAGQGGPAIDTDLLEAFQLGLVDVLDKADASAVLSDAVHSSFFQKFTGGYVWEIVDAPGAKSEVYPQQRMPGVLLPCPGILCPCCVGAGKGRKRRRSDRPDSECRPHLRMGLAESS